MALDNEHRHYNFRNHWNTPLYSGIHYTEVSAWDGFFNACKYPVHARNIDEAISVGITFNSTPSHSNDKE